MSQKKDIIEQERVDIPEVESKASSCIWYYNVRYNVICFWFQHVQQPHSSLPAHTFLSPAQTYKAKINIVTCQY